MDNQGGENNEATIQQTNVSNEQPRRTLEVVESQSRETAESLENIGIAMKDLSTKVEFLYQESRSKDENEQLTFEELKNVKRDKSLNEDLQKEADHQSRDDALISAVHTVVMISFCTGYLFTMFLLSSSRLITFKSFFTDSYLFSIILPVTSRYLLHL